MIYLLGPSLAITMKTNKNNIIYMFGETHNLISNMCEEYCKNGNCYAIDDVLVNIFTNSQLNNKIISFNAEIYKWRIAKANRKHFLRIVDIYDKFHSEFHGINSKYKNVSFNKSDIRFVEDYTLFSFDYVIDTYKLTNFEIIEFSKILIESNIYLKLINIYIYSDNFIKDIELLMKEHNNFYINEFFEINIYYMYNFYQVNVNKKYYSITGLLFNMLMEKNKYVYIKLNNLITRKIKKYNDIFLDELQNINISSFHDIFHKYSLKVRSIILDLHILSNFFVNEYDYFDYIIFYFGSVHIEKYFYFFESIGFNLIKYYNKPKNESKLNCVEAHKISEFIDLY